MDRSDWHGVYSAITTKFDRDEHVDLAAVAADVSFQLDAGVHGIVCCGSLGEASTLTADEKLSIAAAAKETSAGRAPVILTIAEDSTRAAAQLAEEAAAIERAVEAVLAGGYRTPDLARPGETTVSTAAMGDAVVAALEPQGAGSKDSGGIARA